MAQDIINIFNEIQSKYKEYDLKLTAGGLTDVKGENTSDIDISLYHDQYNELQDVFKGSTKEVYPKERATIYSFPKGDYYTRDVNIYVTNDQKRIDMAMQHRKNELLLNQYPTLLSAAIVLKRLGESTESAWAKVLELKDHHHSNDNDNDNNENNWDPFELMARNDIESIAKKQEEKLLSIMNRLAK
ncbi:unnamed protein product [Cunninghamella blakesleeana]